MSKSRLKSIGWRLRYLEHDNQTLHQLVMMLQRELQRLRRVEREYKALVNAYGKLIHGETEP